MTTPHPLPALASSGLRRDLLSQQVKGTRYFFLDLARSTRPGDTLALGGYEQCDPDYLVDRKRYAYYVLEYVAEGFGEVTLNGQLSPVGPGSLFTYGVRTTCRMKTDQRQPMRKYFFAFTGQKLIRRLQQARLDIGQVRRFSSHLEIQAVAEELIREGQRAGAFAQPICSAIFEILLLKIEEAAASGGSGDSLARGHCVRAKTLIDQHAARYRSLEEISKEAGMDVSSLCRLFKRFQNVSPYQYLLRRKMSIAAELLVKSGLLVKEAALRVGFADPFHFARCFKSIHGVAPSSLRGMRG